MEELLKIREPNYLKAEFVVETDEKDISEITEEILELVEEI